MIDIKDKVDCCGCGACVSKCPMQCITLNEDEEGFLYPSVSIEECIDCSICNNVCPMISPKEKIKPTNIFAIKNSNESIRLNSSSGGFFTYMAEKTIKDNGIVFGAKFDENWDVIHSYTDCLEGLDEFRRSKYVQSKICETYLQAEIFLKQGRKVLFTGTPCQIAGLKFALKKNYDNLLTIDFICHGVPSPKVWRKYLNEVIAGNKEQKTVSQTKHRIRSTIQRINFRSKQTGWKKYSLSLTLQPNSEGKVIHICSNFKQNTFMKGFLSNIYLRPACYDCKFKSFTSGSNITMADFWGVENYYPDFDDDKGTSLIFLNNIKPELVFHNDNIKKISVSMEHALNGNKAIISSPSSPQYRKLFFKKINKSHKPLSNLLVATFRDRVEMKIERVINRIIGEK
ncbi:Coenzyme F420 hydrogenase/dehydrogenase, beta subunit C-terminal domain [Ancylomarina sp. 16SWW S1-10-2]|uniref:Coenzyme F420 hydrogenase/dehydrogenase, beta subunit C-terminal domain n=1 Tax=Ancylomarina sp. 16SWW S1-10-2 TaxID=2499681 RepID=UPI0012AE973D|nr:Coenzyme F420 hydrogenase/dehydrogenase, beta subunit C-terminal domain [Ancylomarina sp. 16SWW S1-10-2]MRT91921.1 4Fe-4S dicluster domain-containing protein [Ancylomarina sp. 16SWW S1-10-2]